MPAFRKINRHSVRKAFLFALLAAAVFGTAPRARTAAPEALPFAKGFLVTGGYTVGSVDLAPASGGNGYLTGTISLGGVPAGADVVAAYLYWETISTSIAQVDGAKFRGAPITVVKA